MSNNELARKIKSVCRQGSYEDQLEAVEKLLNEHRPEQLPVAVVMQAEGSDGAQGAAVASEGQGEANTCAGCEHTHVLWINSDWKYFCLDCGAVNICV